MEAWITSDFGGVDESFISEFELRNKIALPADYRKFLEKHDGADVVSHVLRLNQKLTDAGYALTLRNLRGIKKRDLLFDHLDGAIDCFSDSISRSHLAIGYDYGGNQFSMKVRGWGKYKIYWWDMDTNSKVLVAVNFSDLISRIEPRK